MSNKQKTYHLMILDSSSSMGIVRDATISGLNEQLHSVRQATEDFQDQEQILCFVTFGSTVNKEQLWNQKVNDIEDFNRESYTPAGGTALWDAIGMGITKLRNEIEEELSKRQANVVVTIFTDGQENASKEYQGTQVKSLIEEVKNSGQWTVAFVGCGDNVFNTAAMLGISRGDTLSYNGSEDGMTSAFKSMSNARYERTQLYSQSVSDKTTTRKINTQVDFFKNIDIDTKEGR